MLIGRLLCAISMVLAIGATLVSGVWIAWWVVRQPQSWIWMIEWGLIGWGLVAGPAFMFAAPLYMLGVALTQRTPRD